MELMKLADKIHMSGIHYESNEIHMIELGSLLPIGVEIKFRDFSSHPGKRVLYQITGNSAICSTDGLGQQ